MNTTHTRTPRVAEIRSTLRARRAARAARLHLERELAMYTTPADRAELDAILGRYDEDETADIRRMLHRQWVA